MRPSTLLLLPIFTSVASASQIAVLPRAENYDLLAPAGQVPMPQLRNNHTPASLPSSAESTESAEFSQIRTQTQTQTRTPARRRRRSGKTKSAEREKESAGDRNEGLTARQVVGAVAVAVLVAVF
ncbi:hypothetical protein BZA05DRAFT_470973 [Tricharina praecox]|uniref:uncharacterized protein n=1 Tax=Tricharina praecox TaxID=43433 RepID=UPI00221EBFC2|nr:uncharacterized protein BZA05DRAFT_474360 [Tricharina praecox]XP_051342767.1 uncharacterized protein BZA05DRAFT_470973 [Tricharina praecox]KAI5850588.1 hypothetical protein BZA05DRAFT_474360 [Tricharina praecox]KAI5856797.1 hypothetical protein BZA05DRAFT_470973 [Tricharina praecox]